MVSKKTVSFSNKDMGIFKIFNANYSNKLQIASTGIIRTSFNAMMLVEFLKTSKENKVNLRFQDNSILTINEDYIVMAIEGDRYE